MVHPDTIKIRLNYLNSARDYRTNGGVKHLAKMFWHSLYYFTANSSDMRDYISGHRSTKDIESLIEESEKNLEFLKENKTKGKSWRRLQNEYLDNRMK